MTTTLICRVELNKAKGITLTVENEKGEVTQTVEMDGTVIRTTCKGTSEEETSVITQKTDGIDITCKAFQVTAETVTIKSSKDTLVESEQKIDVKSTKAMTLTSSDKLEATASTDLNLSGNNVSAAATSKAELKGMNTDVNATQGLKLSGGTSELSGQMKIDIKGAPIVKVASSGVLDLEGQATTLKGSITTVQGSVLKLG